MCPTITVGSFFRHERSTFLFICSTTSNLNNFKPQHLQPQKRVQNEKKKQNRRPEPRKHTKDPTLAPLFFGTMRLFFEVFWIAPKGPPSFVSIFCTTVDVKKIPKGTPFTFFGTVTLFKNLLFKIFLRNILMYAKGPSFNFHILQPVGVSQSPKCPPSYNFEPYI